MKRFRTTAPENSKCFLRRVVQRLVVLASLTGLPMVFSGCVTSGYKLADKHTPPAVALNLQSAQPAAEVEVRTVIAYQGPGSWKREAYWDEYVVSLSNRGTTPRLFSSAVLQDRKGGLFVPGENPWVLEKTSKKWWERNGARQTGTYLVLGTGTVAGLGMVYAAAIESAFGAAFAGGTVGGGVAVLGAVGATAAVSLPIVAGGTIYMNVHRKHQVEAEFSRRRLVFPITLAPGEVVSGSLFFQLTPSPLRLVFVDSVESQPHDVAIDLASLAGLHVKAPSGTSPPLTASLDKP